MFIIKQEVRKNHVQLVTHRKWRLANLKRKRKEREGEGLFKGL